MHGGKYRGYSMQTEYICNDAIDTNHRYAEVIAHSGSPRTNNPLRLTQKLKTLRRDFEPLRMDSYPARFDLA